MESMINTSTNIEMQKRRRKGRILCSRVLHAGTRWPASVRIKLIFPKPGLDMILENGVATVLTTSGIATTILSVVVNTVTKKRWTLVLRD